MAFQDSKKVEDGEKDLAGGKPEKNKRGRKDGGQEVEPDEDKLKALLPKIKSALKEHQEAVAALNDKFKNWGKQCGFLASVLKKAGKAALAEPETREVVTRQQEQLALALEVVTKASK